MQQLQKYIFEHVMLTTAADAWLHGWIKKIKWFDVRNTYYYNPWSMLSLLLEHKWL